MANNNSLQLVKKDTVDVVAGKIKDLQNNKEIHFPPNYSPENALKSAWLILQETKGKNGGLALESCTKDSIANALLDTVVQGLSPAKKQVYYVVYGNKLQAMRSYFGTIAVTKRLKGVEDIFAQVIYEGDDFQYTIDRGVKKILKHEQKLENIYNSKIVGAYATIVCDGKEYTEIMSKAQIDKSWSKTNTGGGVQKEFPEEMAKRTVINRLCKWFANVSDDSDLMIESFNRSTAAEYQNKESEVEEEIKENANTEEIDIEPDEPEQEAIDVEPIEEKAQGPGW